MKQCQCKGLKTRQLTTQTNNESRINRLNVWFLYVIIECCWFILIVITLSLSAGGRTVQHNVSIHFIPHCQPGNHIPQTITASIGHVDNLFSVDHKVPDVKTSYHGIFNIRLISFIQVCNSEVSTACDTRAKKKNLKARTCKASNRDNRKSICWNRTNEKQNDPRVPKNQVFVSTGCTHYGVIYGDTYLCLVVVLYFILIIKYKLALHAA